MSINQLCSNAQFNQELNLRSLKLGGGSSLTTYEEYKNTVPVLGFTTPQTCTLEITKVGKSVSFELSAFSGTVNAPVSLDFVLPARFSPLQDLRIPIVAEDAGTRTIGHLLIISFTGVVQFKPTAGNVDFTNGLTGRVFATGFSYSV